MSECHHMAEAQAIQRLSSLSESIVCVQQKDQIHDSLQRALERYQVVIVANAFEATRRFNVSAFDAYVLEYWTPDWSGTQLCRHIRRTDPHVPICFHVSMATEEQRKRALRAGADAYLCPSAGSGALRKELDMRVQSAQARSTQARAVEELVIQAELERRRIVEGQASEAGKHIAAAAAEKAAKTKAWKAFIRAGGTVACFERSWQEAVSAAAENLQKKYSGSGGPGKGECQ